MGGEKGLNILLAGRNCIWCLQVMKIVHAIRMGWIKPSGKKEREKPNYYLMWNETDDASKDKKHRMYIPAPKIKLPGEKIYIRKVLITNMLILGVV